jgi:hypothetical protein
MLHILEIVMLCLTNIAVAELEVHYNLLDDEERTDYKTKKCSAFTVNPQGKLINK